VPGSWRRRILLQRRRDLSVAARRAWCENGGENYTGDPDPPAPGPGVYLPELSKLKTRGDLISRLLSLYELDTRALNLDSGRRMSRVARHACGVCG